MNKDLQKPIFVGSNFKWYEVFKSSTADRHEIDNTTEDEKILENAYVLAQNVLQPIRDEFGPIRVNSWFRCEKLERVIARKGFLNYCKTRQIEPIESSWKEYFNRKSHPKGEAADIECIHDITNDDLFFWIMKHLKFDQLIREFPIKGVSKSGWVHVSYSKDNRNTSFTIGGK